MVRSSMPKLLIVDDSRLIRMRLRKMVGEEYEILEAANGKEALLKAVSEKPDGIITDLLMPEMDGFSFMEQLVNKNLDFPIIVLTADIQSETRKRCADLGAQIVLNKPPKAEELSKALTEALEKESSV